MAKRFEHVTKTWNQLCTGKIGFSNTVTFPENYFTNYFSIVQVKLGMSEKASRDWCLGYMMQEYESFPKNTKLKETLDFYFQVCANTVTWY